MACRLLTHGTVALTLLVALGPSVTRAQVPVSATDTTIVPVRTGDLLSAVMQFFVSDALSTRSIGTPGGEAAAAFLAAQLTMLGLEPGGDDASFFRAYDAATVSTEGTLVVGGSAHTTTVPIGDGVVAWPLSQSETVTADGELVFVGYGVSAAEHGWNDFGNAPLDGRILVALAGDPGVLDTTQLRGSAGTPHALLEAKLQEAARRGARGFILLHDSARSGHTWEHAIRSRSGPTVRRFAQAPGALAFAALMPVERFAELLAEFGRDADVLARRAGLPGFQPIPLGLHGVVQLRSEIESVSGANVVAYLPAGRSGPSAAEAVLVTTAFDAGTSDEPASIALLLGAAGALAANRAMPARSVYFIFSSGASPEQVGAAALVSDPPVPLERVAAVVGVSDPDRTSRSPSIAAIDASASGLEQLVAAAAMQNRLAVTPWSGHATERLLAPHAVFAREGVPGLTVAAGAEGVAGRPADTGEIGAGGVSLAGLGVQISVLARLIYLIGDAEDRPRWSTESPYRPAWERLERRRLRGAGR